MWDVLFYVVLIGCLAALAVVGGLFLKGYLTGTSPTAAIFRPKPEKRLDVVDQASIDGRRRLVLVRRDDVEHLIMTGGPVDVVIETNIGHRRPRVTAETSGDGPTPPVFQRTPRLTTTEPADA